MYFTLTRSIQREHHDDSYCAYKQAQHLLFGSVTRFFFFLLQEGAKLRLRIMLGDEDYALASCKNYLRVVTETAGFLNKVHEKALATYPRGINLVSVEGNALGTTFTPQELLFPPLRLFTTYEKIASGEVFENEEMSLHGKALESIKHDTETYDPQTELLWFFLVYVPHSDTTWTFSARTPVKPTESSVPSEVVAVK